MRHSIVLGAIGGGESVALIKSLIKRSEEMHLECRVDKFSWKGSADISPLLQGFVLRVFLLQQDVDHPHAGRLIVHIRRGS